MNAIVPTGNFGALSTRFAGLQDAYDDLGAGVQGGYGHIGYKGKVWSIRHNGEDTPLMRPDGDGPRNSIEVVVIKAPGHISKIWYERGYIEGSNEKPDCFSANGLTPDPAAIKKQANACAACPKNAFGSGKNQDGTPSKGKACSDSKRIAVVPLNDLANELYGGPMLLRVPASSLKAFGAYGAKMQALGYPAASIGTRVSFDVAEAYPKFIFEPIRPLTDAEAEVVLKLRDDARVKRILSELPEVAQAAAPVNDLPPAFSQPAPAPVQAAAPAPIVPPAQVNGFDPSKVVTPKVTAAPATTVAPAPAFDAALDDKIDALLPK